MKSLRKILFPFSLLYGAITSLRNFLYNKNILKSTEFALPIIAVGNLSVGGTGKTPMVEYLVRLLSPKHDLVTLSRGYKRTSKGYLLADVGTKMEDIGDEPFQYFSKFKNIHVAVDANRVEGVANTLKLLPNTNLIILDDAFQHRKIKAGFYILLTSFDDLFFNDFLLPAGNLRESRSGVQRADVVIVTKCPSNLSVEKQNEIKKKIKVNPENVFFSTIQYSTEIFSQKEKLKLEELASDFIAVAGIAKPNYFYNYLQCSQENCLTFPDHHSFSERDLEKIINKAKGKKIITTEKDYMRLQVLLPENLLYYLPIEVRFLENESLFIDQLETFIASYHR